MMHSATKFMSGHSDTMGGIVCVKDEEIGKRIHFIQNAEGSGLAPFDAWLLLRGMKTMALRMARAQANAIEMAELLRQVCHTPVLCSKPRLAKITHDIPHDAD